MRIAINTRLLLPGRLEGIGYYTHEIVRRLPALLPESEFLFCFDRAYDPALTELPRVSGRIVWPPTRDPLLWRAWFDYRMPTVLREWKADVFFSPDGYASLRTAVPQVMVTHDLAFLHYDNQLPPRVQRYYQRRVPRFLHAAKRIITVSEFVKGDVNLHYGTPPEKMTVIGNGVKEVFAPLGESAITDVRNAYAGGLPYFFYLGSVHPRKNIDRLIMAYGAYRRTSNTAYPLLLGGRMAWQSAAVRRAWQESEYRTAIHFLDYLPEAEVASVLGGAAALVYPSLSEGFGVPLLEAMAAEVPILTSSATSLPEVAGPAAVYFDPLRVGEIAEAMVRIADQPGLADRLVAAGRLQRQRYSWEKSAAAVADCLRQAINS